MARFGIECVGYGTCEGRLASSSCLFPVPCPLIVVIVVVIVVVTVVIVVDVVHWLAEGHG